MTFTIPEPLSADTANRFTFTIPGDDAEWSVPLLRFLPMALAESLLTARRTSAFLALFGPEDEPLGAAIRTLTPDQFEALIKAWGEASGVTVGESPASSSS